MKTSKLIGMLVLGCGLSAFASPVEDFPAPETVIEGVITASVSGTGTVPAIMVKNVRILVNANTVIKSADGYLKPSELKVGMTVRVEGVRLRGAFLARKIDVLEL